MCASSGTKHSGTCTTFRGTPASRSSTTTEPGDFTPVGRDRIVVTSTTWRTRVIEHPLHLMDLASGATTLRFGAANAGAEVTGLQWNFGKSVTGSVMSRPETVWWGWIATPAVQEWSVEGELLRDVDGDLPWFPEIYEAPDRAMEPPETLLLGLALDGLHPIPPGTERDCYG